MSDEQAIRDMIDLWMRASREGDTETVLSLMTDDVVFMVPGVAPFGKEAFAKASRAQRGALMEGKSDIFEMKVIGDWAYIRNHIDIKMTPPGSSDTIHRTGFTLTILKKENGKWKLSRDANLLTKDANV